MWPFFFMSNPRTKFHFAASDWYIFNYWVFGSNFPSTRSFVNGAPSILTLSRFEPLMFRFCYSVCEGLEKSVKKKLILVDYMALQIRLCESWVDSVLCRTSYYKLSRSKVNEWQILFRFVRVCSHRPFQLAFLMRCGFATIRQKGRRSFQPKIYSLHWPTWK